MKKQFMLLAVLGMLLISYPASSQQQTESPATTEQYEGDDDTDWGWIGLLGLAGLLGLRGRKHTDYATTNRTNT